MNGYLYSSPHLFLRIKRALALILCALLAGAALLPAPLQEAADPGRVPNPVKSAWFLLWTQELVSYSKDLVYLILALALLFFCLPYWPSSPPADRARWLPKEQWPVTVATLAIFLAIVALTVVAMYFRGENWAFVLPF